MVSGTTLTIRLSLVVRPKFQLARLDTTRHVRLCRAVLFQHGGRRRSSSACVYKFSVSCFKRTCK